MCISLSVGLFAGFATEIIAQGAANSDNSDEETLTILSTSPADGDMDVDPGSMIEITFSSEMDTTTINATTLMLHTGSADSMYENQDEMSKEHIRGRSVDEGSQNGWQFTAGDISGTISYSDKVITFTPDEELEEGTLYTFSVTSDVKSSEDVALENDHKWSFTTAGNSDMSYSDNSNSGFDEQNNEAEYSAADASNNANSSMIDLGSAGRFVILAKESVHNASGSEISGHVGEGSETEQTSDEEEFSEAARERVSGEVLVLRSNDSDSSSVDVTEALEDMMMAFRDASMHGGDNSTSQTEARFQDNELSPGVHEWSSSLDLESDVMLSGSADDMWVFKVGDNLEVHEDIAFTLSDGALAENVFWYVEGNVNIGEGAEFKGIILSMNEITLKEGAQFNGRMYSQTSIFLDDNTVTEPGNITGQRTSTNR